MSCKRKKKKLIFVYQCYDWDPKGSEPVSALRRRGVVTYLDEYDDAKQGSYYCLECGVPCYRSPRSEEVRASFDDYHWGHFRNYSHVKCSYRPEQGESKKFDSESEKAKAVDDEQLVIIKRWREVPELADFLEHERGYYGGPVEDELSPVNAGHINRYVGIETPVPRQSGSLYLIGRRIVQYLGQYIQMPGCQKPLPFSQIFTHVHDLDQADPGEPLIVWGLVENLKSDSSHFMSEFHFDTHHAVLKIPNEIVERRFWTDDYLLSSLIMVTGRIRKENVQAPSLRGVNEHHSRWTIEVEYWGQAAVITSKHAYRLKLDDDSSWQSVSNTAMVELYYDRFGKSVGEKHRGTASEFDKLVDKFVRDNRSASETIRKFIKKGKSNSGAS